MQYFPEHFTNGKGFHHCIELYSSHIKGQTDTIPQLNAIHYFNAAGNDTAIQHYLNDTLPVERTVITYSGDKIISSREYGGTNYNDSDDRFDPALLRSVTTYEYRNNELVHIHTISTDGATSDQYFSYDSLSRRKHEVAVSYAQGVTYTYKVKGKEVTTDRDTISKDYSYSALNVVERISGNGKPTGFYKYTYDEKGRLIKLVHMHDSGKIMQSTFNSYDDQDHIIETINQDNSPAHGASYLPAIKGVSKYHQNGRLVEQINYTKKGFFTMTYKYVR